MADQKQRVERLCNEKVGGMKVLLLVVLGIARVAKADSGSITHMRDAGKLPAKAS